MENKKKKCSFSEHEEIDANYYCHKCKIYLCNKCENFHSKLFKNHKSINLDKDIKDIFTGFCLEENHNMELEYFCRTHNQLCCAACIAKIIKKENGKHKDCDVCIIEDIKDEKINKLKENIKILENLSNTLEESINNLKKIFEKINENKDELKLKIQKIFTKIRNILNNREDELLLEVDNLFDNLYFKEDIIKESEKMPEKIKIFLEKGKSIDKEYNDDNLILLINDCINIENNIKHIKIIEENINKSINLQNSNINFYPKEEKMNDFLESIKTFGIIKNFSLIDSSIIKNDINEQELIFNWIKEKINKNSIEFKLIFRMSENGYTSNDFHKFCDNKGATLCLIKTTKNKIFGGFTPLNWGNGNNIYDKSNQTFLFSLNLKKKFDLIKKENYAICNVKDNGPYFGNADLYLKDNMKTGETYANNVCHYFSNNNIELTGGKGVSENFEVEEFEVFKVLY